MAAFKLLRAYSVKSYVFKWGLLSGNLVSFHQEFKRDMSKRELSAVRTRTRKEHSYAAKSRSE